MRYNISFTRFRSTLLTVTTCVCLVTASTAQNKKVVDSTEKKDFRLATENKMSPKSAVDEISGLVLVNAEVGGSPNQVFKALTTKEIEQWWKLKDVYSLKDWQSSDSVGGKWGVTVAISNGTVVHEWGQYCMVNAPYQFTKTKKMDANHRPVCLPC